MPSLNAMVQTPLFFVVFFGTAIASAGHIVLVMDSGPWLAWNHLRTVASLVGMITCVLGMRLVEWNSPTYGANPTHVAAVLQYDQKEMTSP